MSKFNPSSVRLGHCPNCATKTEQREILFKLPCLDTACVQAYHCYCGHLCDNCQLVESEFGVMFLTIPKTVTNEFLIPEVYPIASQEWHTPPSVLDNFPKPDWRPGPDLPFGSK